MQITEKIKILSKLSIGIKPKRGCTQFFKTLIKVTIVYNNFEKEILAWLYLHRILSQSNPKCEIRLQKYNFLIWYFAKKTVFCLQFFATPYFQNALNSMLLNNFSGRSTSLVCYYMLELFV